MLNNVQFILLGAHTFFIRINKASAHYKDKATSASGYNPIVVIISCTWRKVLSGFPFFLIYTCFISLQPTKAHWQQEIPQKWVSQVFQNKVCCWHNSSKTKENNITFMDINMSCTGCETYWFLIYPKTDLEFDFRKYCQILCVQLFVVGY